MTQPTLTTAERAELAGLLRVIEAADAKLTQRPRRANSEQAKARRLARQEAARKLAAKIAAATAASQPDQAQRDARRLQQAQEGRECKPTERNATGPAHVSFIEREVSFRPFSPAACMAEEAATQEHRATAAEPRQDSWLARLDAEAEAMGLSHIDRHEPSGDELERHLAGLTTEELIREAGAIFEHGFKQPPAKHTPIALGRFTRDSEREAIPSKRSTRGVSGI